MAVKLKQQAHLLNIDETLTLSPDQCYHTMKTVQITLCSMVDKTEFLPGKREKTYNKLRGKPLSIIALGAWIFLDIVKLPVNS